MRSRNKRNANVENIEAKKNGTTVIGHKTHTEQKNGQNPDVPRSSSSLDVRPASLCFQFINKLFESLMVDMGSPKLVANDVFDLVRVEGNGVFLEMVHVHVCGECRVADWWVGLRDHLCPGCNVGFIDFFNCVCEVEL